ncbi:hypothetical protein FB567DRAFT_603675 [Paraphoma chrysanthemicola]|uniref:DUF7730 domain-containing protein n=1 Tax=Paraphoma chrysanthemicola TaxID=798071 RepID=A0A8K0R6S9_9PLEO|nr:hypothetical protein FB567DRAFT_603675 [Paraphoma chrysanthemicola]
MASMGGNDDDGITSHDPITSERNEDRLPEEKTRALSQGHASRGIEAGALSFFDLSSEIRNSIYELVFKHDEPIFVAPPTRDQNFRLHRRRGDNNVGLINPQSRKMFLALQKHDPRHLFRAYQPGLALFLMCRQLYQEASSVFYQTNAFTITLNVPARLHIHEQDSEDLRKAGASWMRSLGSRMSFLRRLDIDYCPGDCPLRRGKDSMVEVWPFLHTLWEMNTFPQLRLVDLNAKLDEDNARLASSNSAASSDVSSPGHALNEMVHMINHDVLGLRKFRRLIRSIRLKEDGSKGMVVFKTSLDLTVASRCDLMDFRSSPYNEFHFVAEGGNNLRVLGRNPTTLMTLPVYVRWTIWRRVFRYGDIQKLSMDNRPNIMRALRPIFTSKGMLLDAAPHYLMWNEFILELKFTERVADTFYRSLRDMKPLIDMVHDPNRHLDLRSIGLTHEDDAELPYLGLGSSLNFHIIFELQDCDSLSDIRFDALPLLQMTADWPRTKAIRLSIRSPNRQGASEVRKVLILLNLQDAVMQAWGNLHPRPRPSTSPRFMVNGHGVVVESIAPELEFL